MEIKTWPGKKFRSPQSLKRYVYILTVLPHFCRCLLFLTSLPARFAKRKCQFRCVSCDGFEKRQGSGIPIKPRDVASTEKLIPFTCVLFLFFSALIKRAGDPAPTLVCVSCCHRNQTIGSWSLSIRSSSAFPRSYPQNKRETKRTDKTQISSRKANKKKWRGSFTQFKIAVFRICEPWPSALNRPKKEIK